VPVYEGDDPDDLKERVLYEGEFAAYPRAVKWFADGTVEVDRERSTVHVPGNVDESLPVRYLATGDRATELRYGENPHQDAALYTDYTSEAASVVDAPQLNEDAKACSYNNYNDADAALGIVREFEDPACAVIKHTNPAGTATSDTLADAYRDALSTDPKSAFGGIVALNRQCDADTAAEIVDSFKEVVVAPGYTDDALDVLTGKDNLRILDVGSLETPVEHWTEKDLLGGRLVQERDRQSLTREDLEVVTDREPTDEQFHSLLFAWQVIKHVKSNAILFADGTETVGVGAGQVSRVDAVEIAKMKAEKDAEGKSAEGAVMASDAFFPFPDGIEAAAEAGIEAVIQPGGSVNDDDVIEAADEQDLAMVFTGQRCFRHE
jgi:phosphoribosylaminoimidazolecarboxamide formyltransferase/IMP cyclohydrolase